jgi:hypothetical protein
MVRNQSSWHVWDNWIVSNGEIQTEMVIAHAKQQKTNGLKPKKNYCDIIGEP